MILSPEIRQQIGPTGLTDDELIAAILSGDSGPAILARVSGGVDPTTYGGTFSRADASTCATYLDANGVVQTVAANIPRYLHYDPANLSLGPLLLLEGSRANAALWNRDFTNAAWVKVTTTVALDQTGADGTANSASSLLATAGNATTLQTLALAAATRFTSCYVKRLTGSGVINMTTDGGLSWTAVTVTAAWTRVSIPAQSFLNPVFGFQIVTNGDKIAVDFFQNEAGAFQSSVIATTTVAVTRSADALSFPFGAVPQVMTVYADGVELGGVQESGNRGVFGVGNGSNEAAFVINNGAGKYAAYHRTASDAAVTATTAPVFGQRLELRHIINLNGSVALGQTINNGAEAVSAASPANAFGAAWSAATLFVGAWVSGATAGFFAFRRLTVAAGVQTLDVMRRL